VPLRSRPRQAVDHRLRSGFHCPTCVRVTSLSPASRRGKPVPLSPLHQPAPCHSLCFSSFRHMLLGSLCCASQRCCAKSRGRRSSFFSQAPRVAFRLKPRCATASSRRTIAPSHRAPSRRPSVSGRFRCRPSSTCSTSVLCSSPTTPTAPPTPCLVYRCPSSSRHHRGERRPVSLFPLLTPNPSHRATLFPWSPPCLASPTACQNRSGATDGRREDARRGFSPARLPQLGSNPVGSPIGLGQN
jgi:hypothetical protein